MSQYLDLKCKMFIDNFGIFKDIYEILNLNKELNPTLKKIY